MPTYRRPDGKPVVQFDPQLEVTAFTLFRRLREGRETMLVDVREDPDGRSLEGARPLPSPDWEPPADADVVLFDDDGREALPHVQRLREAGFDRVRMLFGGLDLYEFSLDPEVVGEETYLRRG